MSFALRPHQIPHVAKLLAVIRERGIAHDGSDTGTGKSFCAAFVAKKLGVETLIICPKSVVLFWEKVLADVGVKATVMNYESCWLKLGKVKPCGLGSFFQFDRHWPLIIFDECHRLGGETSNNSRIGLV